jgi:hypothetical protein
MISVPLAQRDILSPEVHLLLQNFPYSAEESRHLRLIVLQGDYGGVLQKGFASCESNSDGHSSLKHFIPSVDNFTEGRSRA